MRQSAAFYTTNVVVVYEGITKALNFDAHPLTEIISYVFTSQINTLSANLTKWSNTLKQFVSNLQTNCLSVFHDFVELALRRLT